MKPVVGGVDLFEAVASAATGVARALRRDAASAVLFWGDPAEVEVIRPTGLPDDVCRQLAAAGGRHLAALVRRTGRPIRVDAGQLPRNAAGLAAALRAHDLPALALFPLLGETGPLGCLVVPLEESSPAAPAGGGSWLVACSRLAGLQVAAAREALQAILDLERRRRLGLCDGALVVDRWERVVFADGLVRELAGWDRTEPFGRPLAAFQGGAALSALPLGRPDNGDWVDVVLEDASGAVPVQVAAVHGDGASGARVFLLRDRRAALPGRPDATGRILALALRVAHAADELLARIGKPNGTAAAASDTAALVAEAEGALEAVRRVLDRTVDEGSRDRVDLNGALSAALERVADELRLERVRVFTFLREELQSTSGDALGIAKAVRTLVDRARASLRMGGGTLTVRTWAEDGWVCAAISDDGAGALTTGPRGFEPLFDDTDDLDDGLDDIRALLKRHGGRLQVERRPHVWNRYTLMLPVERRLLPAGEQELPSETVVARTAAGNLAVLVVDDNAALRSVLRRFLERRGHSVTEAVDGDQALDIVGGRDFDRVIVDVHMPGKTGPEFYESLSNVAPALRGRTLFMTGGSMEESTESFLVRSGRPAIKKPFDLIELAETVEGEER